MPSRDRPTFWFPVKRYGIGWGPPVRWHGWVFVIVWGAALTVAAALWLARPEPGRLALFLASTAGLVVLMVAVSYWKGEKPLRWRWGEPPTACPHCGYDLTANLSGVCPECGRGIERS